jgi:hypothetical protein
MKMYLLLLAGFAAVCTASKCPTIQYTAIDGIYNASKPALGSLDDSLASKVPGGQAYSKSKRGLLQSDDSETQGGGTVCSTYVPTDGSSSTGCTSSLTPVGGTGSTGGTNNNKCIDYTYCAGGRGYTGCICPDGTTPPNSSCYVTDIPGASCYSSETCVGSCNNACGTASNPTACCGNGYPSGCTAR